MSDVPTIEPEPLSAGSWEPFGWLPVLDTDPSDSISSHRLEFEWADAHVNVIRHFPHEVHRAGAALECRAMYRHDTHNQTLLVLNTEALLAVAPAEVSFDGATDREQIRAFVLHPHDAFVLHRGTWHWGPFPTRDDPVELFNIQGMRYSEDNRSVDLTLAGAQVDVAIPGPSRGR